MNIIFHVVAQSLTWLAGKAHISYEAANVVVYYFLERREFSLQGLVRCPKMLSFSKNRKRDSGSKP